MVIQGIDVLEREDFNILKGKNVGLVINYSFVDSRFRSGLDIALKSGVKVVKIFSPEHGLFSLPDGQEYRDFVHPEYGIPVVSLYGEKKKPTNEDLEGLDMIVYDIQDVGLRYYTFIYTMAYTLESAAENGIPYVVLDRVNPLGGKVIGSRIPENMISFVGGYELPIRYGLTPGELALYFKKLKKLDVDLRVIKLEGWRRDMHFTETGLLWNVPSPNLPTFEATLCYAGFCLIEATNLSEGRGTTKPFQYIGAPWMRSREVYEKLSGASLKDVVFRRREFVPRFSKHAEKLCWGLEFVPLSENADFFNVVFTLFEILFDTHEEFEVHRERFERLVGDERVLEDLKTGDTGSIFERWRESAEEFVDFVDDILLYPGKLSVV